jgi:hypothetical protein
VGYIEFTPSGVEYQRINDPLRYLPVLIVLPFAAALSAALAMAAAAAIAGTAARRTMAAVSELRVPLPRLTFRG